MVPQPLVTNVCLKLYCKKRVSNLRFSPETKTCFTVTYDLQTCFHPYCVVSHWETRLVWSETCFQVVRPRFRHFNFFFFFGLRVFYCFFNCGKCLLDASRWLSQLIKRLSFLMIKPMALVFICDSW